MEIVRNEVSSRMAAALGIALYKIDLLKLPTETNLKDILFDKSKIDRSKQKVEVISAESEDNKKSH